MITLHDVYSYTIFVEEYLTCCLAPTPVTSTGVNIKLINHNYHSHNEEICRRAWCDNKNSHESHVTILRPPDWLANRVNAFTESV